MGDQTLKGTDCDEGTGSEQKITVSGSKHTHARRRRGISRKWPLSNFLVHAMIVDFLSSEVKG